MSVSADEILQSYRCCREVAKKRAKNFYYAFMAMPREKSESMCAVYAFMRYCDDIADEPGISRDKMKMLERWRQSLDNALQGNYSDSKILPAFHDTISKYSIPAEYFHQLIDGAEMDLTIKKYSTFDDLYDYCYKVASVVGLVCIHIFGFEKPEAKKYAEYCGIAFQLTNILRDMKEDASIGRVYIPEEDMAAFKYSVYDLLNEVKDERYFGLMKFEVQRARSYYNAARPLIPLVHESGRPGLCTMVEIYSGLLDKIEDYNYDIFNRRISLSKARKFSIATKALIKSKIHGGREYEPELQS